MATVFVACEHGSLDLVTEHIGAGHAVIPFKDGSALVAWTGNDITRALLDEVPTADMLLGTNHANTIGKFAKMLRDVLEEHGLLYRVPGGADVMVEEMIVATKEGVWRIDQACQTHKGAYACIGNGARPAEAIFSELSNSYKDASGYSKMLRALHFARDFDNRAKGPYRCSIIHLLSSGKHIATDTALR